MTDETEEGMIAGADQTAPGGMPQKALVDELMEEHGWTEEAAWALTWPAKIDAVIAARAAAEVDEPDAHEHGDWDQGGYCNRLVMRNGDADVCGYRELDPPHLSIVPDAPVVRPHVFVKSEEGSGRVCMADGCGEGPKAEIHAVPPEPTVSVKLEAPKAAAPLTPEELEELEADYLADAAKDDCGVCGDRTDHWNDQEQTWDPCPSGMTRAQADEVCGKTEIRRGSCSHCLGTVAPEVEAVATGQPFLELAESTDLLAGILQHRDRLIAAATEAGYVEPVPVVEAPEVLPPEPVTGSVVTSSPVGPEDAGRMKMKVSNSELRTFKRCRRKWWLSYYRGLKLRKEGVGPLSLGNMIHKPLEVYYAQPVRDPETFNWEPVLAEYVEARLADPDLPDHLHGEMLQDYELVKIMLRGYFEWLCEEGSDSEINVLAAEREIEAFLDTVNDVDVFLIGKLDTEVELKSDGRRAFVDHKSVQNLTDLPKMGQKDEQFLTYGLLQRLEAMAQGRLDQRFANGGVWNMLRKVKRTATAKPPFYSRSGVTHNDEAYRNFYARVWGEVRDMLVVRANLDAGGNHHVEAYPNPTRDCAWDCPFVGICPQFDDGSDVEAVLAIEYVQHDPYERYEEIEKGGHG